MGAQRPYQFAKHLPKFGWQAIVLCSDFRTRHSIDPRSDWKAVVKKLVLEQLAGRVQDQSITLALPSLRYADWVDRLWLLAVEHDNRKGTFAPKSGLGNSVQRKIGTFLKLFRGDHSQSWQQVAVYAGEVILASGVTVDVLMAEHGPDAGLFAAHELHTKAAIPWIVDFRDPVLQPVNRNIRFLIRFFLKRKMHSARMLVNVTKAWSEWDRIDFDKESVCITNGFDPDEFKNEVSRSPLSVLKIGAYGNISLPGDLRLLFEGLSEWEKQRGKLAWEFHYFGKMTSQFLLLAKEFRVEDHFYIHESVGREELFSKLQEVDVLVLFSLNTAANSDPYLTRGYLPGKVFELMGLQKPFLVIPGDGGELDELALKSKLGFVTGSKEDLVSRLEFFDSLKRKKGIVPQYDASFVNLFTRENIARLMAAQLNNVEEQ